MIFYFESPYGCGLRSFRNSRAAGKYLLKQVRRLDSYNLLLRPATTRDYDWITKVGGFIPKDAKKDKYYQLLITENRKRGLR